MVLYTPLNYHDVFPEEPSSQELLTFNGRSVYARKDEAGRHRLVQLISTDPNDYLSEEFTPGNVLPNEVVHNSP